MRLKDIHFDISLRLPLFSYLHQLTELSSRCKYTPAKVLMRTESSSQNPITQISFDLVQFYTLILWHVGLAPSCILDLLTLSEVAETIQVA